MSGGAMKTFLKWTATAAAATLLLATLVPSASAAPDEGGALGREKDWTAPAKRAQELLKQTIGDDLPNHPYCQRPLERLELMINASDFIWPSTLTILGKTVQVDINNIDLKTGPYTDPSRKLWWRSGMWLAWRAAVFAENGQGPEARLAARALLKAISLNPEPAPAVLSGS